MVIWFDILFQLYCFNNQLGCVSPFIIHNTQLTSHTFQYSFNQKQTEQNKFT